MRHLATAAGVLILSIVGSGAGMASDLGASGPFRAMGGATCPVGTPDGCAPPPVDTTLPPSQQVRRQVERALSLLDFVRLEESRAALDEALRIEPDDRQALTLRGRLHLTNGEVDAARLDLEHALRLWPDDPDLLVSIALISKPEQALRDLDRVLAKDPQNIDALFARAWVNAARGCLEAAFEDLSANLAIAPLDGRARLFRAQLHLRRKTHDLALIDAEAFLKTQPHDLEALQVKAAAQLGAGHEASAVETYDTLLDGSGGINLIAMPAFHDALVTRGRLNAKLNRTAEAKRDFDLLSKQQAVQTILQSQVFLHDHGYPNIEISGERSAVFDTALSACFGDTVCGPNLFR